LRAPAHRQKHFRFGIAAAESGDGEVKAAKETEKVENEKEKEDQKEAQSMVPPDKYQINLTDPESRIMKAGNGQHFEQSYNAQVAVDTKGSMLILGGYVTNHGNDKKELVPTVASVDPEIRKVNTVAADTGYYSEEASGKQS
jgi:hypothetical protein